MSTLLTTKEAATALGVSLRHIQNLISEADTDTKRSRWKYGRELINLSPRHSARRTIRVNLEAVLINK